MHSFLISGMVKYAQLEGITGKTMVAITSGANMDFDRYSMLLSLLVVGFLSCTVMHVICCFYIVTVRRIRNLLGTPRFFC